MKVLVRFQLEVEGMNEEDVHKKLIAASKTIRSIDELHILRGLEITDIEEA